MSNAVTCWAENKNFKEKRGSPYSLLFDSLLFDNTLANLTLENNRQKSCTSRIQNVIPGNYFKRCQCLYNCLLGPNMTMISFMSIISLAVVHICESDLFYSCLLVRNEYSLVIGKDLTMKFSASNARTLVIIYLHSTVGCFRKRCPTE